MLTIALLATLLFIMYLCGIAYIIKGVTSWIIAMDELVSSTASSKQKMVSAIEIFSFPILLVLVSETAAFLAGSHKTVIFFSGDPTSDVTANVLMRTAVALSIIGMEIKAGVGVKANLPIKA